jgi:hypothetical protein
VFCFFCSALLLRHCSFFACLRCSVRSGHLVRVRAGLLLTTHTCTTL